MIQRHLIPTGRIDMVSILWIQTAVTMKVPGRQRQVQQARVLRPVRPRQADVPGGAARPRRALHLLRQPRAEAEVRGRARPQARPGPVHRGLHEIS